MDKLTKDQRSANMRAIRGKHTAPEMAVRKAAHRLGLRFRLHRKDLPGRPDLVFPKWRTIVFVNGCFWHGHAECRRARIPLTNVEFWREKLSRNIERDRKNYRELRAMGWHVEVIWQCDIADDIAAAAALVRIPTFRLRRNAARGHCRVRKPSGTRAVKHDDGLGVRTRRREPS
jgi:DNA mismatch endonuclease (patch repair protein)